jgi:hypothetical protein
MSALASHFDQVMLEYDDDDVLVEKVRRYRMIAVERMERSMACRLVLYLLGKVDFEDEFERDCVGWGRDAQLLRPMTSWKGEEVSDSDGVHNRRDPVGGWRSQTCLWYGM